MSIRISQKLTPAENGTGAGDRPPPPTSVVSTNVERGKIQPIMRYVDMSRRDTFSAPSFRVFGSSLPITRRLFLNPSRIKGYSELYSLYRLIMVSKCSILTATAGTLLTLTAAGLVLEVVDIETTPNGFTNSPRGWNSFGIQANPDTTPGFSFNQTRVISQCDVLAKTTALKDAGYVYCSLDSGWSVGGNGDEFGRIIYDSSIFDIPSLASHLHAEGLLLGVYVVPGAFIADEAKAIFGTNVTIGSVCSGDNGLARCNFDYSQPAVQEWHNSVESICFLKLIRYVNNRRGVDFIKLDFITPGSPANGVNLPPDLSGEVIAYHRAIAQSGRDMRLDISWKLDRSQQYFDIWEANADSMCTDQDINNGGASTFVSWEVVQRAIDNYRQYITIVMAYNTTLTIYPDMDNLFVGNPGSVSGVTDEERQTIMTHWLGAGANLIVGSDLTSLDSLGLNLLANPSAIAIADFAAHHTMQPRNPGTGLPTAQQLQAWIAGPDASGAAVVVIANYGPDEGQGGFGTSLSGVQTISVSWDDLGISGTFDVHDIWADKDLGAESSSLTVQLEEGQSVLYKLAQS
ncbi:glycoside hydrolase family 27 protein [Daldinia caldariorum]|uniref:glycoside hydrolase family 27 protein n=1 Tax=Daldinia caldariorum TaxID=326644 RepID=UPI002007F3E1|nr:glycoside hydrolase family 27 protein [Daldinia caldariorum]KAI1470658.1 glycoside hydrolase family 27 protein [Daldinia caldariorum]